MQLGFVGTGVISGAVISALLREHGKTLEIIVSPRSESVGWALAAEYPNVRRAASNQEVVDCSSYVFIGVRPQQLDGIVSELVFRPDQTVASFVAGADVEHVGKLCQPASRVVRITPLPTVKLGKGPLIIFPPTPEIESLFAELGQVIVPTDSSQVTTLGYAGGMMATFFLMAGTAIDWMAREGVPTEMGRDYLLSMFEGLSLAGLSTPSGELDELPGRYMTKGGINEKAASYLQSRNWFDRYGEGFDEMKSHLEGLLPP